MRLLPASAVLALCTAPALADAVAPEVVDERAKVLIHVDVGALGRTTLFKLLREDPDSGIEDGLAEFRDEVGLDLIADVRALTVYSNDVEDHWVALLRTSDKLDAALTKLEGREGYSQTKVGGKTIHTLAEDGMEWHGHLYRSSIGGERLFVIAEDVDHLVEAVRVVDGERTSLDEARDPAVQGQASEGAVMFVSADRGLGELGDFAPSAEVSRLITGIFFECGESEQMLFAQLKLTTASKEDAKDIHDVVQGGLAMASLIAGRGEEAEVINDLVDALDVRREDKVVTFAFRYSSLSLYEGFVGLREMAAGDYR